MTEQPTKEPRVCLNAFAPCSNPNTCVSCWGEAKPAEKRVYRVDWRNKRTGFEHFDTIAATDVEAAIRETRKLIRRAERGVAEVDVEFTYVGLRV